MAGLIPRRDFIALLAGSLGASALPARGATLPRSSNSSREEVRGAWIHPEGRFSSDPAKGKQQIRDAVRRLADAHFNLVLPWTKDGYLVALDHPEYLANHPLAKWDGIGFLIEEAARAGMGAELWYAFSEYRSRESPDFDPRVGGNLDWAARRLVELVPDPKTGKPLPRKYENLCPQHPAARLWQMNLLTKTFERYPQLRGVHIEEPGYTHPDECVCDLCLKLFSEMHGKPLPPSIKSTAATNFRNIGTTEFMNQLHGLLQARYPNYIFSTNGAYSWHIDRALGRDWTYWAALNWLDYYAPQIYVNDVATYRKRLAFTMKTLGAHCATYPGIGVTWSSGKNTVPAVIRQIEASREMGAGGVLLFLGPGDPVSDDLYRSLLSGPFRSLATLPPATKTHHTQRSA